MHMGSKFSISSYIPSKYMNQGKPSGFSFHQKSLPYRPNHFSLIIHLRSHGFEPWVTKIIPGFCWIFSGFLHTSLFSYVLAKVLFSRFQKDTSRSQGLDALLAAYPLTEILAACPLTEILFFFLYYYYYFFLFFFFLRLWAFMVLLNLMNQVFFC